MGLLSSSESVICPVDVNCAHWAKYIGYCLCSTRDGFSLALGMISVASWGVAEIPQIMTNYKQKSADGLSIVFLLTWIVGDFLNLFGCMLEPATLPTQYYMAMLYLATTSILTTQVVYYEYIYPRFKSNKRRREVMATQSGAKESERQHIYGVHNEQVKSLERYLITPSSPIPFPANSCNNPREELYIMSARSLSVGRTPPATSFLDRRTHILDFEQNCSREPLLSEVKSPQSTPIPIPKIKTTLCVVFLIFFLGSSKSQLPEIHKNNMVSKSSARGIVLQVGRRLLQATRSPGQETLAAENSSGIGSFLGWGMAAIYLGGRLPQIFLNIKKGNAEGLNPLMFVFALFGNGTYVASILVSSLKWSKIKPNLPWLVDAGGCILLDSFIIIQFIYFRYRKSREAKKCTSLLA